MDERDFFRSVAERTGLSREEATDLTRATLQALVQRLSKGTLHELVRNLPDGLGEQLRHVRGRSSRHTDLDETEKQVGDHTGLLLAPQMRIYGFKPFSKSEVRGPCAVDTRKIWPSLA